MHFFLLRGLEIQKHNTQGYVVTLLYSDACVLIKKMKQKNIL